MPPTGRSFEADQIHIYRVAGGKIVEHAASRNDLLLLNQLGLVAGTEPVTETSWRKPVAPVRRRDVELILTGPPHPPAGAAAPAEAPARQRGRTVIASCLGISGLGRRHLAEWMA